ncbi:MAG: hypothetical protein IIC50_22640 [Planctomycetes bacterium]|nr:hypothetical protein [Planctomycetota bacterium]
MTRLTKICISFVVVSLMFAGQGYALDRDSILGIWLLDEGQGDVTADGSGNGNDGTLMGGPNWVAGQSGDALGFDGSSTYVDCGAAEMLNIDVFSVSFWVNFPAAQGWNHMVSRGSHVSNGTPGSVNWGVMMYDGRESFLYECYDDTGWTAIEVPTSAGEWHHVVATFDGTQMQAFHDGALVGTQGGGVLLDESRPFLIGARSHTGPRSFYNGRLDEVGFFSAVLSDEDVLTIMNNGLGEFTAGKTAADPQPADQDPDVNRDPGLSWTAGTLAATHNVYFGTSVGDVFDATIADPRGVLAAEGLALADTSFDPGRLEFGQTYHWRVDEVNGAPDFDVFPGTVWSFTAEPFSIPVTNVTVTASSSFGISLAENTINGSGLSGDLHGTNAGDMWISGGIPATIEFAFDRVYKLHELWIWNSNQLIESFVGFGAKDVVIEHSQDGANWTVLEGVGPLAQATGTDGYAHSNTIDFGGLAAQQVRITVNSVQGIAPQASLSEVRFFTIPTLATRPNPADGATGVAPDVTLSWGRGGRDAGLHEVYLGTDADSMTLAESVTGGSLESSSMDLELGQSYTWRVDEVNDTMDPSTWTGDIWNFATVDSLVIDDMESYRDEEFLEIWATWVDGFDDPANGSLVGGASGTPETGMVQGGGQSLPMDFGTGGASVSEATRTFDQAQDWTRSGIQSLVLYFKRGADNTGAAQVYVKINDTKIVYEGAAGLPPGWDAWTQWTIDLSAVAGAASVRSLTIGVEGAGAAGVLYVDSIQLFKNAPTAFQPLSWFEAESGAITAPMQVFTDDPTASAGEHIGTADGIGDQNGDPPANGVATYSFDVPEDGVYRLAFRVIITGGSDSFWVRIPGMVTNTLNHASGWVRFNNIDPGDTWHWDEVHSWEPDESNQLVDFTLSAGTHTLEVAQREDGALLDAIALMQ